MQKRTYYLYRHIRLDKNLPFYIGIGTCDIKFKESWKNSYKYKRAYKKGKKSRNFLWCRITKKIKYKIEIIYITNCKKDLFKKEKYFINLYGRLITNNGYLTNITEGGDGRIAPFSKEIKQKLSESNFWKNKTGYENPKSKEVHKFDLNGEYLESYGSVLKASLTCSVSNVAICNSINKRIKNPDFLYSSGKFLWSYDKNEKFIINKKRKSLNQVKAVCCYNEIKEKINCFYSIGEACRHYNISDSNVIKSCKSNFKVKCNGYYWKYNDN